MLPNSSVMLKVLFVCVGNSCRSPMAESVLRNFTTDANNWYVDSAAIADWNIGRSPEPRAMKVLQQNGLTSNHITRQITKEDFYEFDYIFGMDDMNMEDLRAMAPTDATAKIELLGSYDFGKPEVISDPYFQKGIDGFEKAYEQIHRSCKNFYEKHQTSRTKSSITGEL